MNATKNIANYAYSTWANGENVPSPCVSVCQMDLSSGLCSGCYRTLDEIAAWSRMDNDEKRVIWTRIGSRTAPGAGA